MSEYYFDIETTGLEPSKGKIITIQRQELSQFGQPVGDLQILKEWDDSEEKILKVFRSRLPEYPFDFIMVGNNLLFDLMFLSRRAERHKMKGLSLEDFRKRPFLDLKPILVMLQGGQFKGYNRLPGLELKRGPKPDIPQMYEEKRYGEIVSYIQGEAKAFLDVYGILKKDMKELGAEYGKARDISPLI